MKELMEEFIGYLHSKKNVSYNTEISYQRDLKKLEEYFEKKKIGRWEDVSETDIQNYLSKMREENFASATISRNIATIRAFFQYLLRQGIIALYVYLLSEAAESGKEASADSDSPGSGPASGDAGSVYREGAERQSDAGAPLCNWNACERADPS